jgi:hypothetical protein
MARSRGEVRDDGVSVEDRADSSLPWLEGIGSAPYNVAQRCDSAQDMQQIQMGMPFALPMGGKSIMTLTLFEYVLTSTKYLNNCGVNTYKVGYAHQLVDGFGSMSLNYSENVARKSMYAVTEGVVLI